MLESSFGKIRKIIQNPNVIPDILDNVDREKPPRIAEKTFETPSDAAPLLDRLCPPESAQMLRSLTANFQQYVSYRARVAAGKKEDGTSHVHDFVIERSDAETSFYFVDPEHYVGKRNLLRASVSNLMSMRLRNDGGDTLPSVAILRFRTDSLASIDRTQLKMEQQLGHGRQLLADDALPKFLANHPEEILFRTIATPERGLVQSRYVDNRHGLELFLDGMPSAPALEGKVTAHQAILDRFIRLLQEGQFVPILQNRERI